MLLRLDPAAPAPLHEQIAAGIRGAVTRGEVADGERLPAARALADALDVNVHTVLRAYAALRDESLLELRRGRGAVVRAGDVERRRLLVAERVRGLVDEARRQGIDAPDVLQMVKEALA